MSIRPLLIVGLVVAIVSCNQNIKNEPQAPQAPQNTSRFIHPPNEKMDIPYKEYSVDAAKGDTIVYESGSILQFPANAFVDKQGKVVTGKVQVKYREFSSPIDFYLAGIPMQYDSAGKSYTFSSSAMCEVYAYKDGEPVFVNQASKPVFSIATDNDEPGHNVYYLDTTNKKWLYEGANKIIRKAPVKASSKATAIVDEMVINIEPPVKPEEANDKTPVIRIEIDTASIKEFMGYNNLQFQLEPDQQFNPADTLQEWTNVELKKGSSKGQYLVKFSNNKKSVLYKARPVFESKDYKAALKEFDRKNKEYQSQIAARRKADAAQIKKYRQDSLANELQAKKNAEAREINEKTVEAAWSGVMLRNFAINQFGVWNCDTPISPDMLKVETTYTDSAGNKLQLRDVAVLYKSIRSCRFFDDDKSAFFDKKGKNMIVAMANDKFAYLTYEDYDKVLQANNGVMGGKQKFVMRLLPAKYSNCFYIRDLFGTGRKY